MKICAIGDLHGNLDKVRSINFKGVDLILLTGDLGKADLMRKMAFQKIENRKKGILETKFSKNEEKKAFMEAYNSSIKIIKYLTKFAPVYTIFGNVESTNSETKLKEKKIGLDLPYLYDTLNSMKNVRIINNKIAKANEIRIGGLKYFLDVSWVKEFKPSNYDIVLGESKIQTSKVEKILKWFDSIDILVCHQPPFGVLDKVTAKFAPNDWKNKHAGSKVILNYIKRKSPKYVFCGHIHEGKGFAKIGKTNVYNLGMGENVIIDL